ncbi:hypothetical protein ACFQ9Z_22375 [Streptomyces sp. NPDC056580]|uniref:hypothetical protein n=1 Tax=Streptomyces sp. NPDC056580 TaxID=3345872 RepID=UPI0036A6FF6D
MARSFRFLYRNEKGTARKNLNIGDGLGVMSKDSAVVVTAAQFLPHEGMEFPGPFQTQGRPLLGAANVYVTNVGPHGGDNGETGGVEFLLHTDWGDPLDVEVTVTVLEPIESFTKF